MDANAVEKYIELLDHKLAKIPYIEEIEKKTNVKKVYLAGGLVFTLIIVIFNNLAKFLTEILGFVYPAIQSLKAVESKGSEDDIQWLTYWVVFAVMNVADFIFSKIPSYYLLKTAAIVWLIHPETLGAQLVYKNHIRPYLIQNQVGIDSGVAEKANAAVNEISAKVVNEMVKEVVKDTKKVE